jgi:hypothetical protein
MEKIGEILEKAAGPEAQEVIVTAVDKIELKARGGARRGARRAAARKVARRG